MIFHHDDEIQSPHSSNHEKHRSDDCTTRNNKNDSLHLSPPPPPATVSPRRSPRPLRSPLTNVMSRLQKLISLYDGTRTVPAVLERAVQAVFAPTAVLVITTTTTTTTTQSSSSSSPQILQGPSLWTHRFAPWNQALRRVTLHELQIVSDPHVLTFTLVVEPPSTSSFSSSNQENEEEANTVTPGTQHQAFECLVCTATVQDGQILSCMEQLQVTDHPPPVVTASSSLEPTQDTAETQRPETETNKEWESLPVVPARQRRRRGRRRGGGHTTEQDDNDKDNDNDKAEVVVPRDSIHASTCSSISSSGSDLCKGTSLETIEQEGGSIFLQKSASSGGPSPAATIRKTRTNTNNINPDTVTSITIVTDQQQQQNETQGGISHHTNNKTLQLLELDPSCTISPGGQFLLCDVSSTREEDQSSTTATALLFCRQQPQPSLSDQTRYFLDGHVPLWNDDTAVSHHGPDAFFPRYQLDLMDQGDGPCCRRRPVVSLWNGSRYQPMWTVCPEEEDQPDGPFYYYDSSPTHSTNTTPNTTTTTTPELLERAIQVSQTTTVSSLSSLSTTHHPYPFQPQPQPQPQPQYSPTTPVTQQSLSVPQQQPLPDVVIHVSSSSHTTTTPKHGNSNSNRPFPRTWLHMLRGKIKIPPRQDPCLMICLTALLASSDSIRSIHTNNNNNNNANRNDKHGRQFAKLRIRQCDHPAAVAAVSEDSGSSTIHNTQRPTATPKRRDRILHRLVLVTDNDDEDNPCSLFSCPPPLLDPKDNDDDNVDSSSRGEVVEEEED